MSRDPLMVTVWVRRDEIVGGHRDNRTTVIRTAGSFSLALPWFSLTSVDPPQVNNKWETIFVHSIEWEVILRRWVSRMRSA